MLYSLILLLLLCLRQSYVAADGTYECGEHGRFEYCIDEIPGCVIGCHCHPGYYFDTDTKICEPNSKLQNHRRYNVGEPTRINFDVTPDAAYETETATVNNINGHVNEITKNADDLGDWLYNQFFKTIEREVVNNTNEKEELTRRSGSNYKIKKPKRTNKWRKRTKKFQKRSRNDKLKKKLLRITENDSLFDLKSSSSSDSSDSSSSDSSEEIHIKSNFHENDNEHGHKKIVMINKKPKPPLPSFIFLPNLDTSYYPPIGLPAPPPIVPMYPMVPVPPMVPLFRIQDPVADNTGTTSITTSKNDVATTEAVTTSLSTSVSDLTSDTTAIISTEPTTNTEITSTDPPAAKTDATLRLLQRDRKRKESRQRNKNREIDLGMRNLKSNGRQKILQRLKGRLNKIPKFMPDYNDKAKVFKTPFMNQENVEEVPLLDNNLPDEINNEIQFKPLQEEISSLPENVDFKYITELIHRVDLKNKSDNLPLMEYNPLDSIELYRPPRSHKNYYRYYNSPLNEFDTRKSNRPTKQKQINDLYYTNLGRQIATMIRGIDSQNEEMKIEMEGTNQKVNNDPYFNMNSQKSFWERSVRSPLTFLNANNNKFEYLKKSNEVLFNIENKVEIMASTAPALSLQEIENIVKVMEAAKMDIEAKNNNIRNAIPSNKNLNINLWPQEIKIPNKNKQEESWKKNDINNRNEFISKNDHTDNIQNINMPNFQRFKSWHNPRSNENTKMNPFPKIKSAKKPSKGNTYFVSDPLNYNHVRYGVVNQRQAKTSPLLQKPQPLLENVMNPLFLKHRKYFQDNNNIVFSQNGNMSHPKSAQKPMAAKPSYFHHLINHLDYIL